MAMGYSCGHDPPQNKHEREHQCSEDPQEKERIIRQIKDLMKQLERTPCIPRPTVPPNLRFLERKQPRYIEDPDSVPTITHVPLLELRPTSDYKKLMKGMLQTQNVIYIEVPPPGTNHASPPWALPKSSMKGEELLPCPWKTECVCCPNPLGRLSPTKE